MKINPDDPRITAYIMGELDDAETRTIEQQLQGCQESRAFVDELRATAGLLNQELSQEPGPGLSDQRVQQIEQRLAPRREQKQDRDLEQPAGLRPKKARRRWWKIGVPVGISAAAAAAVLLVVSGTMMNATKDRALPGKRSFNAVSGEAMLILKAKPAPAKIQLEHGKHQIGLDNVRSMKPAERGLKESEASVEKTTDKDRKDRISILSDGERTNTEAYEKILENPFRAARQHPLSTFSIDVDTASYANVRRFLRQRTAPPPGAVRIEEMINYFSYDYSPPMGKHPFSVHADQTGCPWNPKHRLVRIGLKGREVAPEQRPHSNLVFLLDVSGSMAAPGKLPLLRRSLSLLVRQLSEADRVAIVVYAGASGLVLPSTACSKENRPKILSALERLRSGGSTNGGAGIKLAYDVAVASFIRGGTNRVILATDGDFNVGVTSREALVKMIQRRAKSGVHLSVLGFGMGNYNDATLEQLTNKGDGNYAYIDTFNEARKVLGEQLGGTLVTIARDVKIQVEFNPARVAAYRLIGYENRVMAARDFDDDKKDAGEIGAGHTVTALYEVLPAGAAIDPAVTGRPLRYQRRVQLTQAAGSEELLTVKLRYKQPDGEQSTLVQRRLQNQVTPLDGAQQRDLVFAVAVAWFGLELRGSRYRGAVPAPMAQILKLARIGKGADRHGYRAELIELVRAARKLRRDQR